MAITELTDDLNIVAALDDEPNDTGGLTPAQLKAKFDEAGNKIKTYINGGLIPDVEAAIDEKAVHNGNVPAGGTTGQVLLKDSDSDYDAVWGVPGDSAATPNMVMTRDASGRAQVTAPNVTGDIALLETVMGLKWDIIQSYTVAGTYTFIPPDLFGDGRDYEVGIFLIGGGGSGGAVRSYDGSIRYAAVSGGGSGHSRCFIMTVTPGVEYAVVVGAGGTSVSTTNSALSGKSGGTSSFDGKTVYGGFGGNAGYNYDGSSGQGTVSGANGAQGASGRYWHASSNEACAYGTIDFSFYNTTYNRSSFHGQSTPNECFNPFSFERCLAAGGSANGYCTSTEQYAYGQYAPTLDDDLSAGSAAFSTTPSNITAGTATSVGCGGGAALLAYHDANYLSYTITSGAGADGAVKIYARKVLF